MVSVFMITKIKVRPLASRDFVEKTGEREFRVEVKENFE